MNFQVVLPDGGCFNTSLNPKKELRGKDLLQNIYEHVKVTDETRDYFGVCYIDKGDGGRNWILPEDNLKTMNFFIAAGKIRLQFEVRLFPKDPDLIFPTTDARRIFRQHMKNLLTHNQIGCDNKTSAMLDAFIVQAELGDYITVDNEKYFQRVADINIYAPTSLSSGTPITEIEYLKMMRMYHKKLNGMSPDQADILYLSLVQKIPMYGYVLYHISNTEHNEHLLALSYDGIHFIYESCLEKFIAPKQKEIIKWQDLKYCEILRKKIKIGYTLPKNTNGMIIEKVFKMKTKYGHKGATRFKADLNKHKNMYYTTDQTDGSGILNSRKDANVCYSTQLPRRANTLGERMSSIRGSIKKHKWKVRSKSDKEKNPVVGKVFTSDDSIRE